MSLYFDMHINGWPVGSVDIRRLRPLATMSLDEPNEYEWTWREDPTDHENIVTGTVMHLYQDGAPALAAAVLTEIAKIAPTPDEQMRDIRAAKRGVTHRERH